MKTAIAIPIALLLFAACGGDEDGREDTAAMTSGQPADDDGADDFVPDGDLPQPSADLGVEPPADCSISCDVRTECLGEDNAACLLSCTSMHEEYTATSAECVGAYETLLGCIGSLSCDEVAEYQTGMGDYPCAEQEIAVDGACAGDEPPPVVCEPWCTTTVMCTGGDPVTCDTICAEAIANAEIVSEACLAAQTAVFECVAALECADYDAWSAAEGEYPCMAEEATLATDCES